MSNHKSTATTSAPIPIIIDTDPGIDDAQAIFMAFSQPSLSVIGLTTVFGNIDVDTATRNALLLTALAGKSVPVAKGEAIPRTQAPEPHATFVHGDSGVGDAPLLEHPLEATNESAVDFIIRMSHEYAGKLVLVPIGPLTNIAAALDKDPSLVQRVAHVVIMGGAVTCPGNVNAYAEANIWNDPHAAQCVFEANWKVLLVGLDVTEQLQIDTADMENVRLQSPKLGAWLAQAHDFYFDFHEKAHSMRRCFLHDPAAILALINPELFDIQNAPIRVSLEGEEKGQTRIDESEGSYINFCASVDKEKAVQHIMATSAALDKNLKGILG